LKGKIFQEIRAHVLKVIIPCKMTNAKWETENLFRDAMRLSRLRHLSQL
jgi:hypothetical protein